MKVKWNVLEHPRRIPRAAVGSVLSLVYEVWSLQGGVAAPPEAHEAQVSAYGYLTLHCGPPESAVVKQE